MSSSNLSMSPYIQIIDDDGLPVGGAKIWTYISDSASPKETYVDFDSASPASNPIVCDAGGKANIWLGSGYYRLVVTDAADNLIWTVDGVGWGGDLGTSAIVVSTLVGSSSALKALEAAATEAVIVLGYRTIGDGGGGTYYWSSAANGGDDGAVVNGNTTYGTTGRWIREISGDCNPRWWGAYGTGTDNDKSFFDNAVVYAKANGLALHLTKGDYLLSSSTDLDLTIVYDPSAKFIWTNFAPATTAVIGDGDLTQHWSVGSSTSYTPIFGAGFTANPRWFGATADGAADDGYAINQAIASVSTNGGVVDLSDGVYGTTIPIVPMTRVSVLGNGLTSQIKLLASSALSDFLITSPTASAIIDDFRLENISLLGDGQAFGAIQLAGSDNFVKSCFINTFDGLAIKIGTTTTPSALTNIQVKNNWITETDGIEIQTGAGVEITDNRIITSTLKTGIKVNPNAAPGIANISIKDNLLTNSDIKVTPDSQTLALTGLVIEGNKVSGSMLKTGIGIVGTYSATGQVIISNNNLDLNVADSTGIKLQAGTDSAISYTVSDNAIQAATNKYGIFATGITSPLLVDGNSMVLGDGTGIKETAVTDATYGTNLMSGVQDAYAVSQPRYCTLGTNFKSQIDGDSTCIGNLGVSGNLTVGQSIVNVALANAVRANIFGLETARNDATTIAIVPGTCNCTDTDSTYYTTTVSTRFYKDISKVWADGTSLGGRASALTLTNYTWYHVFLLGKSTDAMAHDAGFDTSITAANLLSDTAGAGYDTYRRVASVLYHAGNILNYQQIGDNFMTKYPAAMPQTSITAPSGQDQFVLQLGPPGATKASVPPGFPVKANLSIIWQTNNASNPLTTLCAFADANAASDNFYGVIDGGAGGLPGANHRTQISVWTDATQNIKGETNGGGHSASLFIIVAGWEDPRGKYQLGA